MHEIVYARNPSKSEIPRHPGDADTQDQYERGGPMHGYGIAKAIQQISEDVLRVEESCASIRRCNGCFMKGWVTAEWVQAGTKRRQRIYR